MEIKVAYGKQMQKCTICNGSYIKIISPRKGKPLLNIKAAIESVIHNPIGSLPLTKIVRSHHKVVIVVDDITRPTPTSILIEPILNVLEEIGVSDKNILIVFALGVHRKMSKAEMIKVLGTEIFNRYDCFNHEAFIDSELVDLGFTEFGTPLFVNRKVFEADIRILTGVIKPHNLAGYSGGAKAILPGVCGVKTIMYNHNFKTQSHPYSRLGILEKNPLRKDIEEVIKKMGSTFIVNLILDYKENICKVVAGDCIKAHKEGARFLDTIAKRHVSEEVDICICGTPSPMDNTVYQMCNSFVVPFRSPRPIIKKRGIIICLGEALEGISDGDMYDTIVNSSSIEELYKEIKNLDCEIHERAGVQHICELLINYKFFIVSNIKNKRKIENMGIQYFKTLQEAFDEAIKLEGEKASVFILPYAPFVIPELIEKK
jgi:nickel-dependent lactate racemase